MTSEIIQILIGNAGVQAAVGQNAANNKYKVYRFRCSGRIPFEWNPIGSRYNGMYADFRRTGYKTKCDL